MGMGRGIVAGGGGGGGDGFAKKNKVLLFIRRGDRDGGVMRREDSWG